MASMAPELKWLNDRFFQAVLGRESVIARDHDENGVPIPVEYMTRKAFLEQLAGTLFVAVKKEVKGQEEVIYLDAAKLWVQHRERRRYWGVEFSPNGGSPQKYNLWKGFDIEPAPGDWELFHRHIREVICSGDQTLTDFAIGWMARAVQLPQVQAETALVLRGGKGTGKGTFANIFGSLFGQHYLAVSNKAHLIGRFNSHLRDKVLMFVDEGFWAGDVQNEGTLKQLITEPTIPIEAKFQDVTNAPNRLHVVMASNERWVVPASGMERRYFVLDLTDQYAQDTEYFGNIRKQMANGGRAAMLHDLLQYDLSTFDPHHPPMTQGLLEQMLHSLKGFDAWWYGRLTEQSIIPGESVWRRRDFSLVYEAYVKHERRPLSPEQLVLAIQDVCPEAAIIENKIGSRVVRLLSLPPITECRDAWGQKHLGVGGWNG